MGELLFKGAEHIRTLNLTNVKILIRYGFKSDAYKRPGMKKNDLAMEAIRLYVFVAE